MLSVESFPLMEHHGSTLHFCNVCLYGMYVHRDGGVAGVVGVAGVAGMVGVAGVTGVAGAICCQRGCRRSSMIFVQLIQ